MAATYLDINQKQKISYCVPTWLRDEQIKVNITKIKDRISPSYELQSDPIAIACFGPSLNETWTQLRDFKHIISCSGAHKFLIEKGIIPTYHIEVDPREHKIQLVGQPHPDVEYLIASTCNPKYLDHLNGYKVKLWHVFANEEDALRTLPPSEWALTGGSSVGLRAITMARFLGFTELHVFGMDGNEGDSGKHAAPHPSQPTGHSLVEYGGVTYRTTPGMLECARQTWHELDQMPDVKVTFYGTGLVQAMAKDYKPKHTGKTIIAFSKPPLISDNYRELNTQLHRDNLGYGVGGGKHAQTVLKLAETLKTKSIGDYGSGKGYLAQSLPFPIWEYDPAIPGKQELLRPVELLICLHRTTIVETEDGPKSIRWIVANHYRGKVLSLDASGNFVWKEVCGWSSVSNKKIGKQWVKLWTNGLGSRLVCTHDHLCGTVDDILRPSLSYTPANETVGKFIIRTPDRSATEISKNACLFNKDQLSALIGIMLGDGYISKQGSLGITHGISQIAYLATIQALLGGRIRHMAKSASSFAGCKDIVQLNCSTNAQIKHIRSIMYKNGKKVVPGIIPYIDDISLAYWYMDDGCISSSKRYGKQFVRIATHGFDFECVKALRDLLNCRLDSNLVKIDNHGTHHSLRLLVDDSAKFLSIISKYIPNCMEYKLPKYLRNQEKINLNHTHLNYAAAKVVAIEMKPDDSRLYDITVAETHNFVANKTVVHNCTDVLEHIEPEYLPHVLDDMRRCTLKVGYFVIHTGPARKTYADGRNTHLIQRGRDWWHQKLSKFFVVGKIFEKGTELHVLVSPKGTKKTTGHTLVAG